MNYLKLEIKSWLRREIFLNFNSLCFSILSESKTYVVIILNEKQNNDYQLYPNNSKTKNN